MLFFSWQESKTFKSTSCFESYIYPKSCRITLCVCRPHKMSDLPLNWTAPLSGFGSLKAHYIAQDLPCHPLFHVQCLPQTPADFIGWSIVHTSLKSKWVPLLSIKLSHSPDSFSKDTTLHLLISTCVGPSLQLWQNPTPLMQATPVRRTGAILVRKK